MYARFSKTAIRTAWITVVAALTLVLLGACSASVTTTRQVNTDKAEDLIRTFLQDKVDTPVGEVSCPEREAKQGDVFECTAQVDTQVLRLRVTQEDDQGAVSIVMAQAVLDVGKAVTLIEQEVKKTTDRSVKADCGSQRFLVKDAGATFDCRLTPPARSGSQVVVTVKDVEGNVDLRLA